MGKNEITVDIYQLINKINISFENFDQFYFNYIYYWARYKQGNVNYKQNICN